MQFFFFYFLFEILLHGIEEGVVGFTIPPSHSLPNKPHHPKSNLPHPPATPHRPKPRESPETPTTIIHKPIVSQHPPLSFEKIIPPYHEKDYQFQLQWYVISESKHLRPNTPYETKIWGKTYVYWKDNQNQYYAIQNICNHRGALLSKGCINKETNCIQCPYHGLEFDGNGILKKIPGQESNTGVSKKQSAAWNQAKYPILEKEGWIYLNLVSEDVYSTEKSTTQELANTLYTEPEATIQPSARVFCNIPSIPTYSRFVSENLLDILHITYVHSFGNKESPTPLNEPIPFVMRYFDKNGWIHSAPYAQQNPTAPSQKPDTIHHMENELASTSNLSFTTAATTTNPSIKTSQHRLHKHQRKINHKTRAILFRNQVYGLLNPITTLSKKWLSSTSESTAEQTSQQKSKENAVNHSVVETVTNLETGTETEIIRNIPPKNQQYGIQYLFETNPNSVIRKLFHYNHIIIETEFLLPHLTVSRVRFGPFFKTVVSFTLPVTDKETHLFIKLYRNYWLRDVVPSFPFPFTFISEVIGNLVESMADSVMLWMLKETFKEDAGILKHLTNDAEQQGKYNLKYDKFPYLYRNLYKKYIHTREMPILPLSSSPVFLLLDKNNQSSPLFPTSFPTSCQPPKERKSEK